MEYRCRRRSAFAPCPGTCCPGFRPGYEIRTPDTGYGDPELMTGRCPCCRRHMPGRTGGCGYCPARSRRPPEPWSGTRRPSERGTGGDVK